MHKTGFRLEGHICDPILENPYYRANFTKIVNQLLLSDSLFSNDHIAYTVWPLPTVPRPGDTETTSTIVPQPTSANTTSPAAKRPRLCSVCGETGHNARRHKWSPTGVFQCHMAFFKATFSNWLFSKPGFETLPLSFSHLFSPFTFPIFVSKPQLYKSLAVSIIVKPIATFFSPQESHKLQEEHYS